MTRKSQDYQDAFAAETARIGARARSALDSRMTIPEIARSVAAALGRDHVRKQRILSRSPGTFAAMDAAELSQASSRELAVRELKELGIQVGDADPVQLLDMHHQGRQWARDRGAGRRGPTGGASDSAEPTFLDAYLREGE